MKTLLNPLLGLVALGCGAPDSLTTTVSSPDCTSCPSPPTETIPFDGQQPLVEKRRISVASDASAPLYTRGLVFSPDGTKAYVTNATKRSVELVTVADAATEHLDFSAVGVPARLFLLGNYIYLSFRDASNVVRLDPSDSTQRTTITLPNTAEGMALDGDFLHVACRDGSLVSLDAETLEPKRMITLPDDLRDVVPRGDGTLFLSRFRRAELLHVAADGTVLRTFRPAIEGPREPAVAWKTILGPGGLPLMLHVLASGPRGIGAYSGNNELTFLTASLLSPEGVTSSDALTPEDELLDPFLQNTVSRISFPGSGFADVVAYGDGFAVASPGKSLRMPEDAYQDPKTSDFNPVGSLRCFAMAPQEFAELSCEGSEALSAIANHPITGVPWVVDRGASQLRALDGSLSVEFSQETKSDAFSVFHIETSNIACASCHPEGREDGLEWDFEGFPMRTQTLEGGLATAPMHHRGELAHLGEFLNAVFRDRFGGITLNPEQLNVMSDFLAAIPAPPPLVSSPNEHGQRLFESAELGCLSCHSGDQGTDNAPHDVGTGAAFITPPLFRVSYRAPYLHDGAATTLLDVFGLAGGGDAHAPTSGLSQEQRQALVSYLETR